MTSNLNCQLIKSTISGNSVAITKIVDIYQPYINTLASKRLFDDEGNEYIGVNVDLQERLIRKLIKLILTYKIA